MCYVNYDDNSKSSLSRTIPTIEFIEGNGNWEDLVNFISKKILR